MAILSLMVVALASYLLGSINLSIVLSKLMGKGDIRNYGSGNAGTTNTLRVLGVVPAILVFTFDALKGVLAILLGKWLISLSIYIVPINELEFVGTYGVNLSIFISAICAVLGHNYPIYYGFKGGKGIATSLGVILMIEWPIGLICLATALVLIISTRMVSIGSIVGALLYPPLVLAISDVFSIPYLIFACTLAALAVYRHKTNINKLLNGTENKLWHTKAEKEAIKAAEELKAKEVEKENAKVLNNSNSDKTVKSQKNKKKKKT